MVTCSCMHGNTACGIETIMRMKSVITRNTCCMHGNTACGIETLQAIALSILLNLLHAWKYRLRY